MTTSADIANAVFAALATVTAPNVWPTPAQKRVYMPRDWPTEQEDLPILKIGVPSENKEASGKASINFTTTCTLEVIGEVSRTAETDDQSANAVLIALGLFQLDIELAVIGAPSLFGGATPGLVQQLASVRTQYAVNAEGKMSRGAISMTFEFNFFQGREDFQAVPTYDIARFHIYADLINVADPTGTYTPPLAYTPVPPPRDHGPDGRIEGEAEIELQNPE